MMTKTKIVGQKLQKMDIIPNTLAAVRNPMQQKHLSTIGLWSENFFMVSIFKLLVINIQIYWSI